MPRRRNRPLFDTPPGFRPRIGPHDIPPDLVALGWACDPTDGLSAVRRDGAGRVTAFVTGTEIRHGGAGRTAGWSGGLTEQNSSMRLWHRLRCVLAHGVDAMRAIEGAEAAGPLSGAWEGQGGAPEFPSWTHMVRQGRDAWARAEPDGRMFVVVQGPAVRERRHPLSYAAWINTDRVHRPDSDHPMQSSDPAELIRGVEQQFELDSGLVVASSLAPIRR